MILVIDNYDSFTYNLVQYIGESGQSVEVYRNDELSVAEIIERHPEKIVISPGPGTPDDAGVSVSLIHAVKGRIPLLGVCLGHQSIGAALGGNINLAATTAQSINASFGTLSSTNATNNEIWVRIKLTAGQSITAFALGASTV